MGNFRWTRDNKERLLRCLSDEELKREFPNHKLQSLYRLQRRFRSQKRDPSNPIEREPRVLVFDLETFEMIAGVWKPYKVYKVNRTLRNTTIACFSYRWLGEDEVHSISLPDFPARWAKDMQRNKGQLLKLFDDEDVIRELWHLFDEADVIIAHNLLGFDEGKATARFVQYGLEPPRPWKKVDTLKAARRYFGFDGNSLDELADFFGIGRKINTGGLELWYECEDGVPEAWNLMTDYCNHDVQLLHEVYLLLLPYIANHPNVATLARIEDGCPKCGHKRLQRHQWYAATTYSYPLYKCLRCKGWCKDRKSDPEVPKPTYTNIAQ